MEGLLIIKNQENVHLQSQTLDIFLINEQSSLNSKVMSATYGSTK